MQIDFEGQRPDEEVLFIFRRHISTALRGLLFMIVMIAVGVAMLFLWPNNAKIVFAMMVCVLIGVFGFVYALILWYFSFYMVTNQRLRQTRQKGMFKKSVVDLDLEKIMSVSFGVPGMFGAMFDYGTILVQTGAGDLVMSMVAHPETVYNELQNAAHNLANDYDGGEE
ncbi:PH domain-containing protein [Candidatus Saccharibacteria bacterium]|nr:PH domain-containing protein [Candidatus Saccharibacteria bacterium]